MAVVFAAAASLALAACGASSASPGSSGSALDTMTPGQITVAIEPYAPYTSMQGDKMVGLDADILQAAADKLGLKIVPQVTDFNGMLAGVQSQRVDIAIGGIAWTQDRAKVGLFTDPPYYSPSAMAIKDGASAPQTVDALKGLDLGTVTGYVWVKAIQSVPDSRLHTYPDANGLFADVAAGRVNVGFVDPLLISYTQQQRPDLGLQTKYMDPPTDAQVKQTPNYQYFQPYMTGFYVPKQEPKLEAAISKEIDAMYTDGTLAKLIQKYGGDPSQYLTPSPTMSAARQSADRAASWNAPSGK
ncbi:ABC transporter substrate-binding protein [Sinomonas sp. JGH33]|uniref:ABC transporter substrate-binding protein n=1 Tax=Sinomonas terricola TaxID=3110330 RepID=A0ABU5TCQ5_9MICC|nr:ABC transporter substrate-binding protein [Sinomonas sp. JGH33]MEA5456846.1 ABC transporter substrate-binding protein [Sinomonas sp. JGH33]